MPQALALCLLGSLCFLELFLILNFLAFWLDVIWSLLVLAWFLISFAGGRILPVGQMPAGVAEALVWGFPYWTIAAPVERFLGRLDGSDVLRGLAILSLSLLVLDLLRRICVLNEWPLFSWDVVTGLERADHQRSRQSNTADPDALLRGAKR